MKIAAKVASALSFAHLAGIGRNASAKARAEDDEDKPERDHEDGNVKKGKAAEDDDKKDDQDDQRAEDEEDSAKAEDDSPDEEEEDKKESKAKGKAADDDDDEEMRGNSAAAQARRRERARCAAIFASPAAARNPVLAANLAFKTSMGRKEALAVLEATPAAAAGNPARSARNPNIGSGASSQPTSQQAVATGWDRAFAKVGGRRV